jgi:hypothetical protein
MGAVAFVPCVLAATAVTAVEMSGDEVDTQTNSKERRDNRCP